MEIFKAFTDTELVLRRFIRKFVSGVHDVEDICQETVTRALEAERSRLIEDPGSFLFGVTRNVIRKRLEKQSRLLIEFVNDFDPQDYAADEPSVEQLLDGQQQMLEFMNVVATLPPQCQRVFVLKKVYGYLNREIADELDISISTVEKHVAAGLKRCLDELDKREAASSAEMDGLSYHDSGAGVSKPAVEEKT